MSPQSLGTVIYVLCCSNIKKVIYDLMIVERFFSVSEVQVTATGLEPTTT